MFVISCINLWHFTWSLTPQYFTHNYFLNRRGLTCSRREDCFSDTVCDADGEHSGCKSSPTGLSKQQISRPFGQCPHDGLIFLFFHGLGNKMQNSKQVCCVCWSTHSPGGDQINRSLSSHGIHFVIFNSYLSDVDTCAATLLNSPCRIKTESTCTPQTRFIAVHHWN